MMASWMVCTVVLAVALGLAAWLAERGLVVLTWSTRWLWLGVMLAAAGWPFVARGVLGAVPRRPDESLGTLPAPPTSDAATELIANGASFLGGLPDALLIAVWLTSSSLMLVLLLLSAATLREDRRRWRIGTVADQPVLLSGRLGPAVIGTVHPCIVLPRWVLDLDEESRRLIVLHEREHVRVGDSRLLMAALMLLVLLPWCLPLWWQFHRLRLAMETDCDRRLLRAGAPIRSYADVLLTVAERRRRVLLPLAAMAPSRAALERRLRRILGSARPERPRMAIPSMAGAAFLFLGAAAVPVPEPPSLDALAALRLQPNEAPAPAYSGPRPDGSLPGDPGQARLAEEIERHHAAAIEAGLPEESVIWFIADRDGKVARTGIERGTEREVGRRIRARHPGETGAFSFAWSDVPDGRGTLNVIWLLPRP